MRRWVVARLQETSGADVALELGSQEGQLQLRQVLECPFTVLADNSARAYSFERLILPLVHLLVAPRVSSAPVTFSVRTIFDVVASDARFMHRVVGCLLELAKQGIDNSNQQWQRENARRLHYGGQRREIEETVWMPSDWSDAVLPVATLVYLLCTRADLHFLKDAQGNLMPHAWLSDIEEAVHLFEMQALSTPDDNDVSCRMKHRQRQDANRKLVQIQRWVEANKVEHNDFLYRKSPASATARLDNGRTGEVRFGQRPALNLSSENEPPGEKRPGGPRHDNDQADYRQIQIVPTEEETMCRLEAYLPRQHSNEMRSIDGNVDHHLEQQFRLLREDCFAAVSRAIWAFLDTPLPSILKSKSGKQAFKDKTTADTLRSLIPYPDVRLEMFDADNLRIGPCVCLSFEQPTELQNSSVKKRKEFWTIQRGSKRLQVGSLVCIAINAREGNVTPTKKSGTQIDHLLIGIVARREDKYFEGERCRIMISMLRGEDLVKVLEMSRVRGLLAQIGAHNVQYHIMLQVRGHFFPGYEPILKALQNHNSDSLAFADVLVSNHLAGAQPLLRPPSYLYPGIQYDLTPLCTDGYHLIADPSNISDTRDKLLEMARTQRTPLDATQCESVAMALGRAISLIQGPPGTGKTYVGVKIVKTLLHNSRRGLMEPWQQLLPGRLADQPSLQPILCICYTNHALDQFLDDLIGDGIDPNMVVRVGGRCKNARLQARVLHELLRDPSNTSQAMRREFYETRETARIRQENIRELSQHLAQGASIKAILSYLEDHHPWAWHQLNSADIKAWLEIPRKQKRAAAAPIQQGIQQQNRFSVLAENISKPLVTATQKSDENVHRHQVQEGVAVDSTIILQLLDSKPDLSLLTLAHRRALWCYWSAQWHERYRQKLVRSLDSMNEQTGRVNDIDQIAALKILQGAAVVAFTTSGCAKYQKLLRALRPKVIICEEAGEVLESHILSSLTEGTEQLILIGDHLQLRPKVQEFMLSRDSRCGYDLDVSLFERLVLEFGENSLKTVKQDDIQERVICTLHTQRRMRTEIADLLRAFLYPKLNDARTVLEHPDLKGFAQNVWFFDHGHLEKGGAGSTSDMQSYSNPFEAEMVVGLVSHLVRQGYKGNQIAVLTPYLGQMLVIRDALSKAKMALQLDERDQEELDKLDDEEQSNDLNDTSKKNQNKESKIPLSQCVRLATVDNFQGEEADVVVISMVRCNRNGDLGFLKRDNRVNVMISRARHGMIMLGSAQTIKACKRAEFLRQVVEILQERKQIGAWIPFRCNQHPADPIKICTPADIARKAADGGCHLPCAARLECGHSCPRACHPDDRNHKRFKCTKACTRVLECGHACKNLCFADCGPCQQEISVVLPTCKHAASVPCSTLRQHGLSGIQCQRMVEREMPLCGHRAELACHKASELDTFRESNSDFTRIPVESGPTERHALFCCSAKCNKLREECQHICEGRCGGCAFRSVHATGRWLLNAQEWQHQGKCKHKCTRDLFCGHTCGTGTCHAAGSCPPCDKFCLTACEHSRCTKLCCDPCAPCAEPCTWQCPHNGQCELPCGSPCSLIPCNRRCERRLTCGHQCPSFCGHGSICPTPDYCRECGFVEEISPNTAIRSHRVDIFLMTSLLDHDPDDSPLVILPCGHAYTIETMDGLLQLSKFYEIDDKSNFTGQLFSVHALADADLPPGTCPDCRSAIGSSIRRYGRVLHTIMLRYAQRKFVSFMAKTACDIERQLLAIPQYVAALPEAPADRGKQLQRLCKSFSKKLKDLQQHLTVCQKHTPTQRIWELEATISTSNMPGPVAPMFQPIICILLALLRTSTALLALENTRKLSNVSNITESDSANACMRRRYEQGVKWLDLVISTCQESKSQQSLLQARLAGAAFHTTYARCTINFNPVDVLAKSEELLAEIETDPSDEIRAKVALLRNDIRDVRSKRQLSKEELRAVFAAMSLDVGSGTGSFGGHWFTCPNGHVFAIGECGGAMETSRCIECGAPVGGNNHRRLDGNTEATAFLAQVADLDT